MQRGQAHQVCNVPLTPPLVRNLKAAGTTVDQAIDHERARAWLYRAIEDLPAQNRQAVQLALTGLRCRPIGEAMGVCESRVWQLITGAVRLMAAQRPAPPPRPLS